jgi:glycolate oxidase iron-sulfur subunit
MHLDRCLTCRNCETTCPSGVQYGQLIDISWWMKWLPVRRPKSRWPLKEGLLSPVFAPAMALCACRPSDASNKVPERQVVGHLPGHAHPQVLMLEGCNRR